MQYPGKSKKEFKKTVSYGNRGMNLEDLLNVTNEYYLVSDIAVIYKKPTPIQITETKKTVNNDLLITKAFFSAPSTLDYNGIYKGKYIDFDAKETKNKTAFPLANVHHHQLLHMKKIIDHGGISFLIIYINNKTYLLPGEHIIDFINKNERKSIPLSFIEEKGYEIKPKINPRLDYLEIVDKLYFKEVK